MSAGRSVCVDQGGELMRALARERRLRGELVTILSYGSRRQSLAAWREIRAGIVSALCEVDWEADAEMGE